MNNYVIKGKTKRLGHLAGILIDMGHNVFINENREGAVVIVDSIEDKTKEESFTYHEFIDIVFKEFISIGVFDKTTFKLVRKLMMNNASFINSESFKGYVGDDYFIYEHDLLYDHCLDYTIIVKPSHKILDSITNTTKFNIIYGDKINKKEAKNYIYFGMNEDNDFVIKEVKRDGKFLTFKIYSKGFILGEFMFDNKLEPYMRQIVGMFCLYSLEEMNLETLKIKIDRLI